MEYVGEEKRIRELFRELRLENERLTPQFAGLWIRAQAAPARPLRAINLSFALAAALLICALVSLTLWSRPWQINSSPNSPIVTGFKPPILNVDPGPIPPTPSNGETIPSGLNLIKKERPIKLALRPRTETAALNKTEISEAAAISKWESPTTSLLRSPSEQVLTTVPQFNDAVKDMKSFLPSTDKPKEK